MAKKDYIAIADLIKENTISIETGSMDTYYDYIAIDKNDFISSICDYFKRDNPNFDKEKFISYINK